MGIRFATITGFILVAYGFLLFHLYQVQLVKGGYDAARAESQAMAAASAAAVRGAIYFTDEHGATLPAAVNQDFPIIYAVPKDIGDPQEAANLLSPVLGVPVSSLVSMLSKPNSLYALLARKAPASVAAQVETLAENENLKGIYVDAEPERLYPLGAVASQLLGYVGPNSSNNGERGYYGIEQYYNSLLTGDVSGTQAVVGSDLTLTIDPNIQVEAEKVLRDLVAANGATGGSVIVADPATGKILAMGSAPSFDPNNYQSSSIANFLDPAVQAVYEPGSIFKVLTMAAGIASGAITPNTTYDDTGSVKINNYTITNYDLATHGPYGPGTTMTNVIEHSINTGAIFAENKTGNATFLKYMKLFGVDQKTGIDLPGEVAGSLRGLTPTARQVAYDTVAYGQGVAVTPVELLAAISAIANGGTLMRPYVNASLNPQTVRRAIDASTAAQVAQMMVSAVDKAGIASIEGYSLAGKTGSAFIPDLVHGGYTDKLIDSYIGFGPTSNPRFIILIRLNTLPSTALAAQSVVPAWRTLAQYIINYYNIPPDRPTTGN
jgi:cell division protein FtsI/penicillin-binding protein 2